MKLGHSYPVLNLGHGAFFSSCFQTHTRGIDLFMIIYSFSVCHVLQNESRILRVKVIAGIDLAKKDIIGAR